METLIECGVVSLNATVIEVKNSGICILFLSGGNTTLGKERYQEWQDKLAQAGISSVSFDNSGVRSSGTSLEKSSLELRIKEAACVADWMKEHVHASRYVLYGVSMGGYIALGLINERANLFGALILHAPAAYSSKAHNLCFGKEFTNEIKKEGSWEDSLSFDWLKQYKQSVLFIEAENDEIIPKAITEKYKSILKGDKLTVLSLKNTLHGVWSGSELDKRARNEIYQGLEYFIQ